ncbi:MAG: hypothetical protein AAFN11_04975 [Chloroflexota bacterium]
MPDTIIGRIDRMLGPEPMSDEISARWQSEEGQQSGALPLAYGRWLPPAQTDSTGVTNSPVASTSAPVMRSAASSSGSDNRVARPVVTPRRDSTAGMQTGRVSTHTGFADNDMPLQRTSSQVRTVVRPVTRYVVQRSAQASVPSTTENSQRTQASNRQVSTSSPQNSSESETTVSDTDSSDRAPTVSANTQTGSVMRDNDTTISPQADMRDEAVAGRINEARNAETNARPIVQLRRDVSERVPISQAGQTRFVYRTLQPLAGSVSVGGMGAREIANGQATLQRDAITSNNPSVASVNAQAGMPSPPQDDPIIQTRAQLRWLQRRLNPLQMALTAKRNMIPVEGVMAENVQRSMNPAGQTGSYAQWMGRKLFPDAMRITSDALSETVIARSADTGDVANGSLDAESVPVARGQVINRMQDIDSAMPQMPMSLDDTVSPSVQTETGFGQVQRMPADASELPDMPLSDNRAQSTASSMQSENMSRGQVQRIPANTSELPEMPMRDSRAQSMPPSMQSESTMRGQVQRASADASELPEMPLSDNRVQSTPSSMQSENMSRGQVQRTPADASELPEMPLSDNRVQSTPSSMQSENMSRGQVQRASGDVSELPEMLLSDNRAQSTPSSAQSDSVVRGQVQRSSADMGELSDMALNDSRFPSESTMRGQIQRSSSDGSELPDMPLSYNRVQGESTSVSSESIARGQVQRASVDDAMALPEMPLNQPPAGASLQRSASQAGHVSRDEDSQSDITRTTATARYASTPNTGRPMQGLANRATQMNAGDTQVSGRAVVQAQRMATGERTQTAESLPVTRPIQRGYDLPNADVNVAPHQSPSVMPVSQVPRGQGQVARMPSVSPQTASSVTGSASTMPANLPHPASVSQTVNRLQAQVNTTTEHIVQRELANRQGTENATHDNVGSSQIQTYSNEYSVQRAEPDTSQVPAVNDTAPPEIDVDSLAEKVFRKIVRRLGIERERRGGRRWF